MFEGVGAPINVDQTDGQYIDPTLDSCCQREVNIHLSFCVVFYVCWICNVVPPRYVSILTNQIYFKNAHSFVYLTMPCTYCHAI